MEYQLITPRIPLKNLTAVERVLTNRGIALAEIKHYLNTTNDDILDPKLIDNMREGAQMLIKHISANHRVQLQVDSDCDGFSSSALFLNYLYCLFPAFVQNNISYRLHTGKQHGLIPDTLNEDISLAIAIDSSSNDYEEHAVLASKGIDVLVIDHHEAERISENACVINNQLCNYPTKSLCGAAMAYKFCCYIDELLNVDYANQFLDLVALALVADMMSLQDFETKHLVSIGLKQIRNPFFRGMVDKQAYSLRDGVTPFGIAFYIAPYVNATIRMGTAEEKMTLFESMLDYKGYEQIPSTKRGCKGQMETRVEQACRNCSNIKTRQTKARDESLEAIEDLIAINGLLANKILAIKLSPAYAADKNLTGLIANVLMSKYQRPVMLLNKVEKDGVVSWEGSARGYDKSKFDHFKDFLEASNLTLYQAGHQNAFGAGVADEKFDELIAYANEKLKDFDFSPSYKVDYIFHHDDMSPNDILELAELKSIWGQGVEEPLIAIEQVKVYKNNVKLMSPDKNPTLKITLPNGISMIKFKVKPEEVEALSSDLGCVTINVVGKCERNIWNGTVSPQIILEDYEIIGKQEYYF